MADCKLMIDGSLSDSPVTVGVLQGSILGQLLFTLYVNENCLTSVYADDTELEHAMKPQEIKLIEIMINNHKGLYKLHSYFEANKLSLNVPKHTFVLVEKLAMRAFHKVLIPNTLVCW